MAGKKTRKESFVVDLKNLKVCKGARLPFKWLRYNNHTLNLHAPLVVLYFTLWGLVKCLTHALHLPHFILPVFDHCNECCKYSWWFAPVSHHVWRGDDDTFWSTFAIHQMCMWGVRFFPIWNWWLYGSVRESQLQHFHFQIMISWLCHPALWTLKWPLSSI